MEIRPSPSSPSSPTDSSASLMRRPKKWALKCERYCCSVATYFPLAFVYGTTTWAVWVQAKLGFVSKGTPWAGPTFSMVGIIFYIFLNWSYSVAVFTDPGSPSIPVGGSGYSHLPTQEPSLRASLTVKSTGGARYCKKCQAPKPDRAHHCSNCGRCVLKMDHHCPWLAACVGLRNYKPFLLFLIYTSAFCWLCFAITLTWLMTEVLGDAPYTESLMPINYVLLCTISGIFGLVLTVFTGWHIRLAMQGQTTIENLEKTRYLTPLKKSMRRAQLRNKNEHGGRSYGQQLAEIHANALPGITRAEEGDESIASDGDLIKTRASIGWDSRQNQNEREQHRERERYEEYLDEKDSETIPNAFDLGWKRNLLQLFGERYWFLPICNTIGDGWSWEPSAKWVQAREEIRHRRERQWREIEERDNTRVDERHEGYDHQSQPERHYLATTNGVAVVPGPERRSPGKADQILGRPVTKFFDKDFANERPSSRMSMQTLRRRESFSDRARQGAYRFSSEDEEGYRNSDESQTRVDDEWQEWD